jgi:ketosteroid isomerase-like protein
MASGAAELVRPAYEAWNEGDMGRFFDALAPDVEWWPSEQSPEPGPFRGHEELSRFMRSYYDSFEEIRFELEDVLQGREPDQVLVLLTLHTRGKGSGVEVDVRVGHLLTVRDGRIVRGRVYTNPDEAREAAGLA